MHNIFKSKCLAQIKKNKKNRKRKKEKERYEKEKNFRSDKPFT